MQRGHRLHIASLLATVVVLVGCGGPSSPTAPTARTVAAIARLDVDTSVTGGQIAHGVVTLSDPAPEGGVTISLAANHPAGTLPSTLMIPAGAISGSFEIVTARVTTTTDVTITARTGDVSRTSSLRVKIDPAALKPTATYTLGFSSLRENRAAFATHTDSGFTVSVVSADWMAITTYGNPIPFIEFNSVAGQTTTGEIRITAGGAPFWFNSIDLYSSTTKIPYVFEGSLSSDPVFTIVNVLGNTFGNFARTPNPRADAAVDVLLIRLSNPSAPCCSNPMGVDNIVLSR
jgi:hypothetical protein